MSAIVSPELRRRAIVKRHPRRAVLASIVLIALAWVTTGLNGQAPLQVFPGAEGFGSTTVAGRGGVVLRVTNLNDSGTGSLRAAMTAAGPRTVIFEISGTITLTTDDIKVNNPYLTVAGQTAPSPGITIRGGGIRVFTHDVLVQHLRGRPGDVLAASVPRGNAGAFQALGVGGGAETSNTYNVVFDHVSASWATDQNMTVYSGIRDVTFSNSIISEGLIDSPNNFAGQCHSCAVLVGERSHRFSLIRNLMAHTVKRFPEAKGDTSTLIVNNLMYNNRDEVMDFYDYDGHGPLQASIVGNCTCPRPEYKPGLPIYLSERQSEAGTQVYQADNVTPGVVLSNNVTAFNPMVSTPPLSLAGVTVRPSSEVETYLKSHAGARPADRDAVDTRIVSELTNRTGRTINAPGDVGGYPAQAVNVRPLTLPANPNGDDDGDRYTNLEEWLHAFSAVVEGGQPVPAPAPPTNVRIIR